MTVEGQRFYQETVSKGAYGLFDCNVRFSSNYPPIIEALEYLYGPSVSPAGAENEEKVSFNLREDGLYELYVPGLPLTFYKEMCEILLYFKARLLEFFWRGKPQPLLLHAGAVVKNEKGILLAGNDNSGKTTLTLGLVNREGFNFLSDEYGLCDERGLMRAYPAPVSVRHNSLVLQRNLLGWAQKVRGDLFEVNVWEPGERYERKPLFPAPLGNIGDGVVPKAILLLAPNFGAVPKVEPIIDADLVLPELVENASWHKGSRLPREEVIKRLETMLKSGVVIYRLGVGQFDQTLEVIEELADKL